MFPLRSAAGSPTAIAIIPTMRSRPALRIMTIKPASCQLRPLRDAVSSTSSIRGWASGLESWWMILRRKRRMNISPWTAPSVGDVRPIRKGIFALILRFCGKTVLSGIGIAYPGRRSKKSRASSTSVNATASTANLPPKRGSARWIPSTILPPGLEQGELFSLMALK